MNTLFQDLRFGLVKADAPFGDDFGNLCKLGSNVLIENDLPDIV